LGSKSFQPLGLADDGTMEVPDVHDPARFGWYCPKGMPQCGAPSPGQTGPSVIISHVNGDGHKGGFYNLAKVKVGDIVQVGLDNGVAKSFKVSKTRTVSKTNFPTDAVWGYVDHPALRLITCGGVLDRSAHSYESNIIVFADLL
jgi:LPXTG-site transpeptidase (sortase) family protein